MPGKRAVIQPEWMRWYGLQRWRNRSDLQRKRYPLCAMCLENKIVNPAEIADHITPHNGNQFLFWYGKLQSLCHQHHNEKHSGCDAQGFSNDIGDDGFPFDVKHPFNKLPPR